MRHKRWLLGLKASQPIPRANSSSSVEFAGIDSDAEGVDCMGSDVPMKPIELNNFTSSLPSESDEEGMFTGLDLGQAMENSGDADDEADDDFTPHNRSLHCNSHHTPALLLLQGGRRPPPKFNPHGDLPPSSPPTSSEVECDDSPTLSLPPRHYRDPPGARGVGQNFPVRKTLGSLAPGEYDRPNGTQPYNRRMGLTQSLPHFPTPGSDSE